MPLVVLLCGAFLGISSYALPETLRLSPALLSACYAGLSLMLIGWVILRQKNMNTHIHEAVVLRTQDLESSSKWFRTLTDGTYDIVCALNQKGGLEYINNAWQRVLGYRPEELEKKDIWFVMHPKDQENFKRVIEDLRRGGGHGLEFTFRAKHKKGHWVILEGTARGLQNKDWETDRIAIHARNATARYQYAEELARSEQRFRDFSESSADWMWEVDTSLNFTYVSPGVKGVLGYSAAELLNKNKLEILFHEINDSIQGLMENRINRHQPYRELEFWARSKTGERICLRMSGIPVFDENHNFSGYRGVATNVTTGKLDREHMFRLATTDHLTGLLNRNRFMEELERTVNLARRHKTEGVLLFIDLDQFKHINDSYGHEAGDTLLRGVAEILKREVRSTDVVARLGGDEFGIIMHKIPMENARQKVQSVIERVNQLDLQYKDIKLRVTMSIGMISYPQEEQSCADLFMSADLAMYRAKDMGRNRMFIDARNGDMDVTDSIREQLKWVDILRKSLDTGDFEMHFQPIVPAIKEDKPYYEALIRLRDENGKLGAPFLFIDAAEHFGLIQHLDQAVIARCFEIQRHLHAKNVAIRLAINLSSRSLGDPDMVQRIHDLAKHHKVNPSDFTFEITETAAIHDPAAYRNIEEIKEFIKDLRAIGFRIALDDFGIGFSSFNYIRSLDIDIIKIDGSYIKNLETSKDDYLFVKSISELAAGLGIKTVAEFVENENILGTLKELGIDYAQGYHLSRPEYDIKTLHTRFKGKSMVDFSAHQTAPKSITATPRKNGKATTTAKAKA